MMYDERMIKSFLDKHTELFNDGHRVARCEAVHKVALRQLDMLAAAMRLRVPATRIGAIIHGQRGITADTAIRLVRFFGTTPEFWLNIQTQLDLSMMLQKIGDEVERDVCALIT